MAEETKEKNKMAEDTGFINYLKKLGKKPKPEFCSKFAWIESTYGGGTYMPIEMRIKYKQEYIKNLIESKFKNVCDNGRNYSLYSSYHCVIDIEEDIASHAKVVFEPFVKGGFTIINLSERVSEIDEPNVYLISWKNAFKEQDNQVNTAEKVSLIEE